MGEAHHIREFKGTVNNGVVSWKAKDVKVLKGHEGHGHSGALRGDRIELRYSGLTFAGGKAVFGTVTLDRKPDS
jgi:hypothetical protein